MYHHTQKNNSNSWIVSNTTVSIYISSCYIYVMDIF